MFFRSSCAYDSEKLQTVFIKYLHSKIKSKYPQKIYKSALNGHRNLLLPSSAECRNELDFTAKGKPIGIATTYHPTEGKNH